jgi:hypothetical protein
MTKILLLSAKFGFIGVKQHASSHRATTAPQQNSLLLSARHHRSVSSAAIEYG